MITHLHIIILAALGLEAELSSCDRDLYGSQHLKSLQLFMEGVC